MSNNYTGIVSYSVVLIIYMFSLKASAEVGKGFKDLRHLPDEIKVLGQFRLHFYTVWTFILQILFLVIAILDEASKLLNFPISLQKRVSRARALLFNTLVLPCSLMVVSMFWTIWKIDRELIFPSVLDTFYPLWLNHMMHTFIIVPLMIELALPKKYNFVKARNAAVVLTAYVAVYQSLYFSVYLRFGVWLYGIYGVLTWPQRLLFTLFQWGLLLGYQRIGIAIQDRKRNQTKKLS